VDAGQSDTFSANPAGGSGGYSYSWTALPQGCQSSNSATLTCNPSTPGTYPVQVAVTDSNNFQVQSSALSFVVHSNPTVSLAGNRTVLDIGESIFFWANASGGSGVYSYWYQGLPCPTANLSRLTCTPSARGTYTVTVTVNDTLGNSGTSGPFFFGVDSDPTLNTWLSRGGFIGYANASLILQLNYSGGTPNYRPCINAPGSILGGMACGVWQGGSKYAFGLWYTTAGSFAVTASLLDSTGWNVTTGVTFTIYYTAAVGTPVVPPVDTGQGLTLSTWEAHGAPTLTSWWNDSSTGSNLCGPTTTSPGATLSCTFTASWTGPHTLNITLRDGLGTPYYLTFTVSPNARPALSVQSLPAITLTNATLNPTASVSGGSANFRYCFETQAAAPWTCSPGGGTSSTSYTFPASYASPGSYTLSFSVLDAAGVNATTTRTLTVYYPLSVGSLTVSPSPSDEGWSTSANATLSNGVAGFVGWINDTTAGATLCGPVTLAADGSLGCTFRPSWTGTHSLLLTVRDSLGTSRSSARTLSVNAPLSIALFNATAGNRTVGSGGSLSTEVGAPVFLNATFGQGSPSYTCAWSSGATTIAPCSGSVTTLDAVHEWSTVGTYTVTFTATDAAGASVAEQFVLTVSPTMTGLVPSAQWSPVDAGVLDNLTLSFQNGVAPFSFSWQFGDNHTAETLVAWAHHAWLLPGSYAINVTIRDGERANVSTTLLLTVAPALAVPCAPVSHGTLQTNDTLNFTLSCRGGGTSPYHYHWSFGDGKGLTSQGPWGTHAFSSAGQFQVALSISDAGGGNATSVGLALQVQNPSPGPGPGPGSNNPPGHSGISAAEWFLIAVVLGVVALLAATAALALRRRARRGPGLASSGSGGSGGDADATPHIRMSLATRPDQTETELIEAVSKESGLDHGTVGTQLALLVKEGTVQKTGGGPDATYRMPGAQASSEAQNAMKEAGTTAQDAKEEEEMTTRGRGLQAQVRQVLPEQGYVRTEELASKLGVAEPWLNSQLFVMEQRGELTTEEAPPKSGHFVVTRAANGVMFPAELRSLPPDNSPASDRGFPGPTPGPPSDLGPAP
ncbi:MAG: PKD domain-containing protein, partial [Euryarchaeota archaeon]|nr:PKD domain-containing protein [Euryarchaeota archaeon]